VSACAVGVLPFEVFENWYTKVSVPQWREDEQTRNCVTLTPREDGKKCFLENTCGFLVNLTCAFDRPRHFRLTPAGSRHGSKGTYTLEGCSCPSLPEPEKPLRPTPLLASEPLPMPEHGEPEGEHAGERQLGPLPTPEHREPHGQDAGARRPGPGDLPSALAWTMAIRLAL